MTTTLLASLDHLVLDADGCCYVGDDPVPGTADVVATAREQGKDPLFVTNDTTRSAAEIADHLGRVGIPTDPARVLHAGRAIATHLHHAGHRHALVIGTPALCDELRAVGVQATPTTDGFGPHLAEIDALVVGNTDTLVVRDYEVAIAAWRPGMTFLSGNADRSYPGATHRRLGCGSVAAALEHALDAHATPVGKPAAILFDEAAAILGPGTIGLVGDSVRSDVAGANRAGWVSIWYHRPGTHADGDDAPRHVIESMTDLLVPYDAPPHAH